jgi:hypothetical protein
MAAMAVMYRRLTADLSSHPDIARNLVTVTCRDGRDFTKASALLNESAIGGLFDAFGPLETAPGMSRIASALRTP